MRHNYCTYWYCNLFNQLCFSLGKLTLEPQLLGHRGMPTVRGGHLIQGRKSYIKNLPRMSKGDMRSFWMTCLDGKGRDIQPKVLATLPSKSWNK